MKLTVSQHWSQLLLGVISSSSCIKTKRSGVGALQIAQSVQRAVAVAKREKVSFPLNKAYSLPHRIDGYWGAAKVMLRPAADGAGVIAGALPSTLSVVGAWYPFAGWYSFAAR